MQQHPLTTICNTFHEYFQNSTHHNVVAGRTIEKRFILQFILSNLPLTYLNHLQSRTKVSIRREISRFLNTPTVNLDTGHAPGGTLHTTTKTAGQGTIPITSPHGDAIYIMGRPGLGKSLIVKSILTDLLIDQLGNGSISLVDQQASGSQRNARGGIVQGQSDVDYLYLNANHERLTHKSLITAISRHLVDSHKLRLMNSGTNREGTQTITTSVSGLRKQLTNPLNYSTHPRTRETSVLGKRWLQFHRNGDDHAGEGESRTQQGADRPSATDDEDEENQYNAISMRHHDKDQDNLLYTTPPQQQESSGTIKAQHVGGNGSTTKGKSSTPDEPHQSIPHMSKTNEDFLKYVLERANNDALSPHYGVSFLPTSSFVLIIDEFDQLPPHTAKELIQLCYEPYSKLVLIGIGNTISFMDHVFSDEHGHQYMSSTSQHDQYSTSAAACRPSILPFTHYDFNGLAHIVSTRLSYCVKEMILVVLQLWSESMSSKDKDLLLDKSKGASHTTLQGTEDTDDGEHTFDQPVKRQKIQTLSYQQLIDPTPDLPVQLDTTRGITPGEHAYNASKTTFSLVAPKHLTALTSDAFSQQTHPQASIKRHRHPTGPLPPPPPPPSDDLVSPRPRRRGTRSTRAQKPSPIPTPPPPEKKPRLKRMVKHSTDPHDIHEELDEDKVYLPQIPIKAGAEENPSSIPPRNPPEITTQKTTTTGKTTTTRKTTTTLKTTRNERQPAQEASASPPRRVTRSSTKPTIVAFHAPTPPTSPMNSNNHDNSETQKPQTASDFESESDFVDLGSDLDESAGVSDDDSLDAQPIHPPDLSQPGTSLIPSANAIETTTTSMAEPAIVRRSQRLQTRPLPTYADDDHDDNDDDNEDEFDTSDSDGDDLIHATLHDASNEDDDDLLDDLFTHQDLLAIRLFSKGCPPTQKKLTPTFASMFAKVKAITIDITRTISKPDAIAFCARKVAMSALSDVRILLAVFNQVLADAKLFTDPSIIYTLLVNIWKALGLSEHSTSPIASYFTPESLQAASSLIKFMEKANSSTSSMSSMSSSTSSMVSPRPTQSTTDDTKSSHLSTPRSRPRTPTKRDTHSRVSTPVLRFSPIVLKRYGETPTQLSTPNRSLLRPNASFSTHAPLSLSSSFALTPSSSSSSQQTRVDGSLNSGKDTLIFGEPNPMAHYIVQYLHDLTPSKPLLTIQSFLKNKSIETQINASSLDKVRSLTSPQQRVLCAVIALIILLNRPDSIGFSMFKNVWSRTLENLKIPPPKDTSLIDYLNSIEGTGIIKLVHDKRENDLIIHQCLSASTFFEAIGDEPLFSKPVKKLQQIIQARQ